MEESNEASSINPELYFLIAKFLSGGPLKETAKALINELQTVEVLPRRLDWQGDEHTQSYDELASQYSDMSWSRLAEVCQRALSAPRLALPEPLSDLPTAPMLLSPEGVKLAARLSLLGDVLVRPPHKFIPYKQDHSLVRRLAQRERGGRGGASLFSPRMLTGLQLQRRTLGHLSAVYCLLFDCTGRYVITGADDLLVKVWSAHDGRLLCTLRGAGAEITDVCISADGALLAAGSVERTVRVWRLPSGAPAALLAQHQGTITAVHWAPPTRNELRWLASTSTDGSVAFWTCSRDGQFLSQPVHFMERSRPGACHMICAAWSPGGAFLAAGSADHYVRLYQLEPGSAPTRLLETSVHEDAVDSISWNHRGLRFVSGSKDGTAALWSLHATMWRHTRLVCARTNSVGQRLKVTMVCWDRSDQYVITAVSDTSIRVWCARSCRLVRSLRGHRDEAYVLEPHPFLPAVFLSAGHDGQLIVWDAASGETLASFHNVIEGQGDGAIFDAAWGSGHSIAATDSHGHLLLLGLGAGHRLFQQLPQELFFHTDYRPLVRDAMGGALDEQTETPPHLMPPPFLVDVEGAPHPPELQRLVPGREKLALSQLIPDVGASAANQAPHRSQLDLMIEALARRNNGDGALLEALGDELLAGTAGGAGGARGVWRGEGVRHTAGAWQAGGALSDCEERAPLRPPSAALTNAIEAAATELNALELGWYRREMRRRPVMISTDGGKGRKPPRRPAAKRDVRAHPTVYHEEEPEAAEAAEPESSGSSGSYARRPRRPRRARARDRSSDDDSTSCSLSSSSGSSQSSSSSDYSDWECGAALAPPARARRRRTAPAARYSPSAPATPTKRSERVANANAGAQGSANVGANVSASGEADDAAAGPSTEPTELPEAYRPGEWLTAVSPRKAPYHPQMGDECVYFRLGHQRYFEAVSEKDIYKVNPRDKPWERTAVRESEFVKVVGIKYVIKPPRVVCLKLAIQGAATLSRHQRTFTVRYHDMPDVIDFLVLRQQYDVATARSWKQGDRFRCMIDDSWWTGAVLERLGTSGGSAPPETDAVAAHFLSLRVRWDNGEVERLSPWDLEPIDADRLPCEPGGAVPVLPGELAAVLYKATPGEWGEPGAAGGAAEGERVRVEACARIADHIGQVMSLSVAEAFCAPVDLQQYPSYAMLVPYPIDLSSIRARFESLFYRRAAAAQFDVRYLAHNAEQFNRAHSHIVRSARLLTDLLLYIISNWQSADVVAQYRALAASYHSSEGEQEIVNTTANKRRYKPFRNARFLLEPMTTWRDHCYAILRELMCSSDSEPFREPVRPDQAPDYHAVVSTPMHLALVASNLGGGRYRGFDEFVRDVRLIFTNSRAYNTNKRSRIYSMTVRLSALFEALLARSPPRAAAAAGRSQRHRRGARHSRASTSVAGAPGGAAGGGGEDSGSQSSDGEPLAVASRRRRERSAQPPSVHKGKGVGKRSKARGDPEPGASTSRVTWDEEPPPVNGHASQSPSDSESSEGIARQRGRCGSREDSWSPQRERGGGSSMRAGARKRGRRRSSSSDRATRRPARPAPRPAKRVRSLVTDGSGSSSSSSSGGSREAAAAAAGGARYESDRSYRPRYSSDDDAPLTMLRQRNEEDGEDAGAGPSQPATRRKKSGVSLRKRRTPRQYNEDSEDECIAAISKRLHPVSMHRRNQLAARGSLPGVARATLLDHTYYNGHAPEQQGESSRSEQRVSISSRGRVRKLTAKARGLLGD